MIRMSEMKTKDFLSVVFQHQELCDKLDNYIYESEFNYVNDKLNCFNFSCASWEIGCYNHNYLTVKDSAEFLSCVQESISKFGCSDRLKKLVDHAEKLCDTNLFDHYVEKVCSVYLQEELQPTCDLLEDVSYAIYCKDVEKFCKHYDLDGVECFKEYYCDNYTYDEETKEVMEHRNIA